MNVFQHSFIPFHSIHSIKHLPDLRLVFLKAEDTLGTPTPRYGSRAQEDGLQDGQGCRQFVYCVWNISDKMPSVGQFGYGEYAMVGQSCVQLFNGWTVLCPTVQWSDSAVSNCPMFGQCCVQLSNGWTVLCLTVQWLDSAVSNVLMVGQCCVQLSNGWTVHVIMSNEWSGLCPTVITSNNELHWLIYV